MRSASHKQSYFRPICCTTNCIFSLSMVLTRWKWNHANKLYETSMISFNHAARLSTQCCSVSWVVLSPLSGNLGANRKLTMKGVISSHIWEQVASGRLHGMIYRHSWLCTVNSDITLIHLLRIAHWTKGWSYILQNGCLSPLEGFKSLGWLIPKMEETFCHFESLGLWLWPVASSSCHVEMSEGALV